MEHKDNKYLEVSGNANFKISTKMPCFDIKISPVLGKFPSAGEKVQDM